MNRNALRQVTIVLPEDLPIFEGQHELVRFTHSTSYDYHSLPSPREQYINMSNHFILYPFESVASAVEEGDPEKILDLGLRYYAGCTVDEDIDLALSAWELIACPPKGTSPIPKDKLTPSVLGRASSYLANACWNLMNAASDGAFVPRARGCTRALPTGPRPQPRLAAAFQRAAAAHADAAARAGHVSPAVLNVARDLLRRSGLSGVSVRRAGKFAAHAHLWRAWDAREAEMAEEQRVRDAKVGRAPNAYGCAAPGCGVMARERKAFMRCAGGCPPERKPHYCSKECQRKAWKAHKAFCKLDSELDGPVSVGSPASAEDENVAPAVDADGNAIVQPKDYEGPDRFIEMPIPGKPGETVTIHSRHLTPEALRIMRDYAVDQAHRGKADDGNGKESAASSQGGNAGQ